MSKSLSMRRSLFQLAAVACLTIGCHDRALQLTGSRFAGFGASELVTEYRKDPATNREIALLHILFVSPLEPPAGGGFGTSGSGGGTVENYAVDYTYSESSERRPIHSEPVRILNGTTVRVSDRAFSLEHGNVFVAEVNLQGAVHLTQLRLSLREKAMTASSVLAAIKGLVTNARVQALKSAD
jgi:hypothetical protein